MTEYQVRFYTARGGGVMTKIGGVVCFPDRRQWSADYPASGDDWIVTVCGVNPRGTVKFLAPVERLSTREEREEKARQERVERERRMFYADLSREFSNMAQDQGMYPDDLLLTDSCRKFFESNGLAQEVENLWYYQRDKYYPAYMKRAHDAARARVGKWFAGGVEAWDYIMQNCHVAARYIALRDIFYSAAAWGRDVYCEYENEQDVQNDIDGIVKRATEKSEIMVACDNIAAAMSEAINAAISLSQYWQDVEDAYCFERVFSLNGVELRHRKFSVCDTEEGVFRKDNTIWDSCYTAHEWAFKWSGGEYSFQTTNRDRTHYERPHILAVKTKSLDEYKAEESAAVAAAAALMKAIDGIE